MSSYSSIKRQEIHKNRNKNFRLTKYFKAQKLSAQNDELRAYLRNEENLRFLINERRLQGTVEELGRKNYYLGREGRILRGLVGDYQYRNRFLKGFALMVFILGQLVVGLYLLGLFDGNNACVTIF